jgi:predicted RNA binding protein YcfA (HicA-like mRNA interferase family)
LRPLSGREFAPLIEKRGRSLLRVSGSHHIYGKLGEQARLSVPMHGAQPLKAGLQNHLAKLAGLTDGDVG